LAAWRWRRVAAIVFYPNVRPALASARRDYGIPPAWQRALTWMREATPDPFGDPNHYWSRASDDGPRAAYAVMNWWDYGYWLMRIAHRVPVSNPTQNAATLAARFFTETDPAAAMTLLRDTRSRYILTGAEMPLRTATDPSPWQQWFPAMTQWADRPQSRYYDAFAQRRPSGELATIVVFYPAYYETMASRLYLFGGAAVTPRNSTWVMTWERRTDAQGARIARLFARGRSRPTPTPRRSPSRSVRGIIASSASIRC
jgi:asparagine N-glycosylation enzyme membrane subunit Stt3